MVVQCNRFARSPSQYASAMTVTCPAPIWHSSSSIIVIIATTQQQYHSSIDAAVLMAASPPSLSRVYDLLQELRQGIRRVEVLEVVGTRRDGDDNVWTTNDIEVKSPYCIFCDGLLRRAVLAGSRTRCTLDVSSASLYRHSVRRQDKH